MVEVTLEGRRYGCRPLSVSDRIRYTKITNRIVETAEIASIEVLLLMVGIDNPPHVDTDNVKEIFAALKPLLTGKE